jgi:hypothetical protein
MTLTAANLIVWLDAALFLIGMLTMGVGVSILALRTSSADIHALAAHTARLAQKGLADDISGLVGNASALVDSMSQLVRTNRGVGIFLCIIGGLLMAASVYFAIQIYQVQL